MVGDVDHGTGVCFKCGSTEHKINACKVKLAHGVLFVVMLMCYCVGIYYLLCFRDTLFVLTFVHEKRLAV